MQLIRPTGSLRPFHDSQRWRFVLQYYHFLHYFHKRKDIFSGGYSLGLGVL